ncbi:glycoside hydrolase family 16 protein [Streptomyces kaniharaensis]|uniref:Glycoside hydrolase family 16 protein n=1 Tax=Streptomyces kaniharaensis TaxID=212423 RepID=A0A6N7KUL1_9ACTN|nr:glycoside hydrolase family 16 protein [Streptomyces kaniharaensis]MQS15210.1 glycoside hydrolase family 16 protein [Streptomyces kaniharaensis]
MSTRSWTVPRALPALWAWIALLATLLPAGNPLRVAVAGTFLLTCPGAAAVGWGRTVPSWFARRPDRLVTAVLAVTLSAAMTALTAEALFFAHAFSTTRAVLVLAVVTTVLVLLPRPSGPAREPGAPRRRRNWRTWLGSGLLLAAAACGTTAGHTASAPSGSGAAATISPGSESLEKPPGPGPWHLVFKDDFNGSSLDRSKWATCYDWNDGGCTNAGNNELEWYQPGQIQVANGVLTLTAERRPTPGADGKTYPWRSGMISTGRDHWDDPPRHTFTYGYFVAALKAPMDPVGMFPAFWLLPADTRGGLPELDVAEFINTRQYADLNLHNRTPDGKPVDVHGWGGPTDFAADYHVFAMDWQPQAVTWYVDGVPKLQVTDPAEIPHTAMELLLNLAVGYQQTPPPDVNSAQLRVDWVAVWQH